MSAQINLYHPRFLKQRELLTLNNVASAAVVLFIVLGAFGGWAAQTAAARKDAATAAEAQLKLAKEQVDAATKDAALRKPSPQLIAELESAEALLRRRGDIARLLESGVIGNTGGFADYLRGFARQVPEGLWLTGFTIGAGGTDMEIRGSMLSSDSLPDYIRRLGTEKVFQGRNFASLTMNRAEAPPVVAAAAQGAAGTAPRTAPAPRSVDFVLMPSLAGAKEVRR